MPSRPPSPGPRQKTREGQVYATRRELQALLAVIEQNTTRINRLEDVFALHAKERSEVKEELEAIKDLFLKKR